MSRNGGVDALAVPKSVEETVNWLRMLTREINTFVLFLQTWSAIGFAVAPELASSIVDLQSKVMELRSRISGRRELKGLADGISEVASQEAEVYGKLTEEIKRFKEESEGIFPAFKLNFDPCF